MELATAKAVITGGASGLGYATAERVIGAGGHVVLLDNRAFRAIKAATPGPYTFILPATKEVPRRLAHPKKRTVGVRIGADPLGGAAVDYWGRIGERYDLDLTVVNPEVDPTWRFMTLDWDGKIRMDCSSPYAMASLIGMKDRFDIAFGNDADADRLTEGIHRAHRHRRHEGEHEQRQPRRRRHEQRRQRMVGHRAGVVER